MAEHLEQMSFQNIKITAALGFILGAVAFGFLPLLWLGFINGFSSFDAYLPRVVAFTLKQAFLSTVLSLLIAIPVALAFARRQFWGRDALLKLFSIPLALPAIVAILGIVGVYGNNGTLGGLFSVYGLSGILLAHVFFNMPMAVRLLLTRLDAIPAENFRLGAQLGFTSQQVFRFIEWPQLASAIPGIASLIFLLCTASFAVVLILGGGPQATTLEVAIYQSLRVDFDPARASILAFSQLAVCGVLVLIAGQFARENSVFPRTLSKLRRFDGQSALIRMFDVVAINIAALIVLPPMVNILVAGITNIHISTALLRATLTSFGIGLFAACISLALGWILADRAAVHASKALRAAIMLACLSALIMPPAVLATGWFVTLSPIADVSRYAVLLVVILNALMALPFVWSPLFPAITDARLQHDRLCASLGLSGFARLKLIDLPTLRKPLALGFLMAMIVSLGDLSAISLFGSADFVTLPSLIMAEMGHYRMDAAAGTALVLAAFCFALIALAQYWSRSDDHA
jgi:thiamine transport system permease protein